MKLTSAIKTATALAIAGLSALPALASTASVNFTSFSYVVSGGSLTYAPSDAYQSLYTEALSSGGVAGADQRSGDAANWNAMSFTATTATSGASAVSQVGQTFQIEAHASPSVGALTNYPNSAMANASQSGTFTLSQAGSVTFTIGYALSVGAVGGNAVDDYGYALATLSAGNYSSGVGDMISVEHSSFSEAAGVGNYSGTLTYTVALGGPSEVGYYNLASTANVFSPANVSAVPEPSDWAMMSLGISMLACFTAVRRRRHGPV
jgi:hypothetical protein